MKTRQAQKNELELMLDQRQKQHQKIEKSSVK